LDWIGGGGVTQSGILETRFDLVKRLYNLEAAIEDVESAIEAVDAVISEVSQVRPLRRAGSPIATAVAAILQQRQQPVHATEVAQLLAARGVQSRNPRSSVATALGRLTRQGQARRVGPGTYEWVQLDSAEKIVERLCNVIPFVPRQREETFAA
jgi:hypothetical protein